MNKAKRIRELDNGKRAPSEIAAIVGCRPEYVQAVRQRARGAIAGTSVADLNYLKRRYGGKTLREMWNNRYNQDPKYKASKDRAVNNYRRRQREVRAS
jgi:hypothetical protein